MAQGVDVLMLTGFDVLKHPGCGWALKQEFLHKSTGLLTQRQALSQLPRAGTCCSQAYLRDEHLPYSFVVQSSCAK